MDISYLDKNSIKIRSKHAAFVVDPPVSGPKISCDAIVLLEYKDNLLSKVVDYRIVINGPGEYEINSAKVMGVRVNKGFVYSLSFDGLEITMGRTSDIAKIKDNAFSCQIAILNVDDELSASIITNLEPKIVILYGDNKENGAKILGKENLLPAKKLTISKDKLPEDMEVVGLG